MARTKILVSKEVLQSVLFLPSDVKIEDVSSNPDKLNEVIFMLEGNVPDTEWSTVLLKRKEIELEIIPMEKG